MSEDLWQPDPDFSGLGSLEMRVALDRVEESFLPDRVGEYADCEHVPGGHDNEREERRQGAGPYPEIVTIPEVARFDAGHGCSVEELLSDESGPWADEAGARKPFILLGAGYWQPECSIDWSAWSPSTYARAVGAGLFAPGLMRIAMRAETGQAVAAMRQLAESITKLSAAAEPLSRFFGVDSDWAHERWERKRANRRRNRLRRKRRARARRRG